MPRIFDNIEQHLQPALAQTLQTAYRADFCVGYFNLRGWQAIDEQINTWTGGETAQCRLLVGMHRLPQDQLHAIFSFNQHEERMSNPVMMRLKQDLAEEFRQQLTIGAPNNQDEATLRRLAQQLKDKKVVVKLFLRHPLHAKLYLLYHHHYNVPIVGFMGSSNLTFSGLQGNGELNIDVTDGDAAQKLSTWFEDRWTDRWCIDISEALINVIEESWAGDRLIPPYHVYLKMAYHLSREARAGLSEFNIPRQFEGQLFDFQTAAVKIAARHLNQRGGVLIGDVVGLGKTMMATAVAKIFHEDYDVATLVICPKNLKTMWEDYLETYNVQGRVLSITRVLTDLPEMKRYRQVIIDESHNLRNRDGKRYRVIQEYIQKNDSRCILLSATPYNKTYRDLSNQLRLFWPEEADLGLRPEKLWRELGEIQFSEQTQTAPRTLAAFELSKHPDDWRDLMSLFMVRRTRSFIKENYAHQDPQTGRRYLQFANGKRAFFPERTPKRLDFAVDDSDQSDQYAQLYAEDVVDIINNLALPRYGLGNYISKRPAQKPNAEESKIIEDLSRGRRRLMGFSRTNLFKRLESSGYAFLLSVERHILRNYIFIHALKNNLPLPIGTQDVQMMDTRFEDDDAEATTYQNPHADSFEDEAAPPENAYQPLRSASEFEAQSAAVYAQYASRYKRRFRWLRADLFTKTLQKNLQDDALALLSVIQKFGVWYPQQDAKLNALHHLLTQSHPTDKILIFSQFADTVTYLTQELEQRNLPHLAGVTGSSADPTALAWRFSPKSNGKSIEPTQELRVLIATDVLSEGQNLQDAAIVVNFDLPWAIIRLIQRAGRIDRIGQQAEQILCYTFWPADGVERIIRLRERLRQRLSENAEVVGTDESFFEENASQDSLVDLYHEKSGILDDDPDDDIDLVSQAYQIWKNATDANPSLKRIIPKMSNNVYTSRAIEPDPNTPPGVLVYINTAEGNPALAWVDQNGHSVTESQATILKAAACSIDTPALPREENHHTLVEQGVKHIATERRTAGGQLGRRSGARFRVYQRLKRYLENNLRDTFFEQDRQDLQKVLDELYRYPLQETAKNSLNRQLRSRIIDADLAELTTHLQQEGRLCLIQEESDLGEPQIVCSIGLI